ETWSHADQIISKGMYIFVDNKFLTIFACLFGVGIAQQWRRWEAAGHDATPLHLRRMLFLLGIGLLHAFLLRNGDILAPYALMGLALLLFRRSSNRTLIIAIVALMLMPYIVLGILSAAGLSLPNRPNAVAGSFLAENLAWLRYWYETNPLVWWPRILALMI